MSESAAASAPASSANLGPGFDVLALALELRCRVEAVRAESWSVTHHGEHSPLDGAGDAVLDSARRAVGSDIPLRLSVDNSIPLGKGLGSSAAAIAAGTAAAWRAVDRDFDPTDVYDRVAELEGHCDNAAAAVFGGLVMCGDYMPPQRLELHPIYRPFVLIPPTTTYTKDSRGSISDTYQRAVVVRTISRVTHLVAGLTGGDPSLLEGAGGDEIHEVIRGDALPQLKELMEVARSSGAAHVAVSGSGPTVLALVTDEAIDAFKMGVSDVDAEVLHLPVAEKGLD
ncbi:MAG: hypothetical protein GEU79_12955 [Acidimicrobiia bacterium]|nr:hypothetical protein [Acidimicrobiia bacterium]